MHEPVLTPDISLLYQMAFFFASYFVLNRLVYKPYLALLKLRREQTVGLRATAEKDLAASESKRHQYEEFLKAERKKISAWSDEERKKVQEDEREIIHAARQNASKVGETARTQLEEEKKKTLRSLEASVNEFSSAIVSKMLGRKIQVSAKGAGKKADTESTVQT